MYEVTQDYLDKATAAGRVYSLRVDIGEVVDGAVVDKAQYLGGVGVLSLKIVRGQTTGGFSLGGTVCAQLSATFTNDVDVRVKDRLQVYVRFGSGDDVTAWRGLGWFYVDSVKQGLYSKSVTAYDAMLRLEKNYKSKLTYPAKTSDVLNEISDQTNINLSSSLSLINDATIETIPQTDKSKDGEQKYYTRRAMLGYIAATNAGEAYIDVDFKINFAMPTETGYTIEAASVISQTIDDTDFMVDGIVWNKSGISYSLNDDFAENTVELTNPLEYTSEEQILHSLETKLVGLSYSSITLKKQGTGIFQLGDLVDYAALDGTVYTMLVMGIVYDFSNGFFSETLYSLAKSASQQEYAGSQVTDQKEYISSGSKYVSLPLSNTTTVTYDAIERGMLSVDFDVDDTDSVVVFAGVQQCTVVSAGTVDISYRVDGATQDFKPSQVVMVGKNVLPHYFTMALNKGKHNFAVYILSEDGGRGTTDIGWLTGALSGQISGIKNNKPSNENLILYLSGIPDDPDGTEVTLPAYMYANKSAKKYVDWGDGSAVEESTDYAAVSHTYAAGDYVVTIKSGNVSFGGSSMATGTNFAEYLKRVYFPDGAAGISWGNASKNFSALEAVTFGTSAAKISWDFTNSTLITSIIIPDTVTTLTLANIKNTAVVALVIPEKVTSALSLGACASLKTLEAYGSGSVSAQRSTNLQKLTIGKNMASIGTNGYDGCTNLSEVVFLTPSKLTSIGNAAFRNCAFADVDLPSTVETIGENAFYGCSNILSIVLPEKLTTLGKSAFNGCTGLTTVRVGSALTSIGYGAFSGCINLDSINFPDGLISIGELAFSNTGAISPEFPSSLVTINTKAFQKSGITAAVLRANMTVGTYAFSESGLAELTIENGFAAIPSNCFYSTTSLESVSIPGSVTDIGGSAFYQSGLKTLHLSEGLETIGASAFRGSKLTSVTLPASVTDVGNYAFNSCSSLTGVTIKGNTTLGTQAFSSCGSLASVDMGNTANIPGYCFNGCANLNSVSFAPDTVVGNSAFSGCGFTSLSLGHFHIISTLTDAGGMYSLGSGAFANCSNLATVDGLKYKWDVGLKTRTSYIDGDGNRQWHDWEDKGCVEQGIYDSMGATTDSVFSGTKLYNYTEYLKNNGLVNTNDIQYSVYHYTGRNPAYTI